MLPLFLHCLNCFFLKTHIVLQLPRSSTLISTLTFHCLLNSTLRSFPILQLPLQNQATLNRIDSVSLDFFLLILSQQQYFPRYKYCLYNNIIIHLHYHIDNLNQLPIIILHTLQFDSVYYITIYNRHISQQTIILHNIVFMNNYFHISIIWLILGHFGIS